jgi:hypothetical protein
VVPVSGPAVSRAGSLCGVISPVAGALGLEVFFTFPKKALRAFSNESCVIAVVCFIWAY